MNPFYNHTNVGGAFEFKVNDSGFRVGVGVVTRVEVIKNL